MASCPSYVAPFGSQLKQGGRTGAVDCTAWATRIVIATSTCGAKVPSGRVIRLQTSEPIPDTQSPGLNLNQVATVARRYGVTLDVRTGARRVTWAEYERRRKAGQPAVIQVDYAPIADSRYDAGRGFRRGHAIAETNQATYDSLADGRAAGVWKFDGTLYTRSLMRLAAGRLVIGESPSGQPIPVGPGFVWAAFGRDVVPTYRARVPRGSVFVYEVVAGRIVSRDPTSTGGFSAACNAPRSFPWPAKGRTATLVQLTGGSHAGWFISANYAKEIP